MSLLFLQHGNYAEAWHKFREGGRETYRDQQRSVSQVEALSNSGPVTVVSCGDTPHDEQLTASLRSIRISKADYFHRRNMAALVKAIAPTKAVSCSPNRVWHRALAKHNVPTLPLYADYLSTTSLFERLRVNSLSRALKSGECRIVANHSLQASKSLRALRYADEDIIPWEFQPLVAHRDFKTEPSPGGRFRLLFAGAIQASKGVGDCVEACQRLTSRGIDVELLVAGKGEVEAFRKMSESIGMASRVKFLGSIPLDQVGELMRSSDLVVVPSRHEYAEGLPNVIYEALASRTPLVCSDHPSFAPRLPHRTAAMHFSAADSDSLADAIEETLSSADLYRSISENSAAALESLYVGIERLELVKMFVADPTFESQWHRRIPSLKTISGSREGSSDRSATASP